MMSLPTEVVDRCVVCNSSRHAFWFASEDLLHEVPGTYSYRRCVDCRSIFQSPRVEMSSLGSCYPSDYFTHVPEEPIRFGESRLREACLRAIASEGVGDRVSERLTRSVVRRLPLLAQRVTFGLGIEVAPTHRGGRALEIGPGSGGDLSRLRAMGWVAEGLDIDPQAASNASIRSGCPVHVGDVTSFEPDAPYDLIYSSHSLEHIPNTADAVLRLRAWLAPRGKLVAVLPNCSSLVTRLFGPLAVTLDPPRHVALPAPDAFRILLNKAGFEEVVVRTTARRAAHYSAIARARRKGMRGQEAWAQVPDSGDRVLALAELVLSQLPVNVGEEIITVATLRSHE